MEKIDRVNKLRGDFLHYLLLNKEDKVIKIAHELSDDFSDSDMQYFLASYYKSKDLDKAIKYFKDSADQGNIKSINELGKIYYDKNNTKEICKLIDLVEKHNHNYVFFLKMLIARLHAIDKEIDDVVKETIDYNSTEICTILKIAFDNYERKENHKKSFKILKLLEKYYDSSSYYRIAQCYKTGKGVEKDINKYFEYLLKANSMQSLYELGSIYYNGDGVDIDLEKALSYFIMSYKKGNKLAPLNIAAIFEDKRTHLYNPKRSDKWFEEYFRINSNNKKTIEAIRNFVAEIDNDDKIRALMKKYWGIEDFKA